MALGAARLFSKQLSNSNQLVWALIVIFSVGPILYLILGRKKEIVCFS
jgi:hypothetical protein